jgi:NADH:ubiquinone reductase (H+-translocating)
MELSDMSDGKPMRVLILGGGFGGVYTALELEKLLSDDEQIHVTLVSRDNYFVMTPLLFEAGSGVLEPRHAVNPIRPLLSRTRFIEAEVRAIDLERKTVSVQPPHEDAEQVQYDHLVLALGGITNTRIVPGSEHALTFKNLGDAIYLRNHVIQLFERADIETDPQRKASQLTFVIVGGGLVAVELAGELITFLTNLSRLYPRIAPRELRLEVLEGAPYIIAEMDRDLGEYAADTLGRRGVRIRVNTRVDRIEPTRVHLPDGESIESETIIMATGVVPSPLVAGLPIEKDKKGRAITEPTMRSQSHPQIWALGDCASIPDPSGKPYPPLAQHAIREATQLAQNIVASIRGNALSPFVYNSKGTLAALGHFKGVGKIYNIKIRGFLAWWVWRTYYLFRMPRWNRRLRIVLDWTIALLFKNDIVQLDMTREQQRNSG